MNHPLQFDLCGRSWHLHRGDMESLWKEMDQQSFSQDERLPYWAELWPSSLALASWLQTKQQYVQGQKCLDMGCGLGFSAVVGAWLGARVVGMDYEEAALKLARINTDLNLPQLCTEGKPIFRHMDWRQADIAPQSFSYIWGGDIMYEKSFAQPVAAFLALALTQEGVAWLAEPGRVIFSNLLEALPSHGLCATKVWHDSVQPLNQQESKVPVSIWEISKTSKRNKV